MKRRIIIEVDDDVTQAELESLQGCEDAFGLSSYVSKVARYDRAFGDHIRASMKEFGIEIISDERID